MTRRRFCRAFDQYSHNADDNILGSNGDGLRSSLNKIFPHGLGKHVGDADKCIRQEYHRRPLRAVAHASPMASGLARLDAAETIANFQRV